MAALIVLLLIYWLVFTYVVSAPDDPGGESEPVRVVRPLGSPQIRPGKGSSKADRSHLEQVMMEQFTEQLVDEGGPAVSFSLDRIDRSDTDRNGKCRKEICHRQCDPVCGQYPQKVSECRTVYPLRPPPSVSQQCRMD